MDCAVGCGVAVEDVVDAGDEAVDVVCGKDGEHVGHLHARHDAEGSTCSALFKSFGGSEFHGLLFGNLHAALVACSHDDEGSQHADHGSHFDACHGEVTVAAAQQEPAADAHDEGSAGDPAAGNCVEEFHHCRRRECHGGEIHHFVAHGLRVELHAHGVLHPSVGHENPPGRERGSQSREPGGSEVEAGAHLFPAEEHDGDEGGLHEECHDAFNRQRGTEDVAHEPGVVAPVRAELEFQDETCGDADGEVDAEEFHPKLCALFPELIFLDEIDGFHDAHDEGESQGERDEEPVIAGGQCELRS